MRGTTLFNYFHSFISKSSRVTILSAAKHSFAVTLAILDSVTPINGYCFGFFIRFQQLSLFNILCHLHETLQSKFSQCFTAASMKGKNISLSLGPFVLR